MSGWKRKHAFDQGGRLGNRAEKQIGFQRIRRHAGRNPATCHQRADFGGEQKSPVGARIIERLDAQSIARDENSRVARGIPGSAGSTSVPNGEGEHPAEFAEALFAPFLVGVNDDFGVGMGAKRMAASFERATQLPEIVDLAVEDDGDVVGFVEYGLVTAGKVNDTEAAHSERHGGSDEQPVFVRAAMPERLHHPARNGFGLIGAFKSNDATNSAHPALLYLERQGSSTAT